MSLFRPGEPIMDGDQRTIVWIVGILAAFFLASFQTCSAYSNKRARIMTEAGYEETVRPGSSETVWHKAQPKQGGPQ